VSNPQNPFGSNPFGADPFGGAGFGQNPHAGPPVFTTPPPHLGPPRPPFNSFATLSVIFAFLFAPAGVVLGHLALGQIHRTRQLGRARALTGLVASYVVTVVMVIAVVGWTVLASEHSHNANGLVALRPQRIAPLGAQRPPRDLRQGAFDRAPTGPRWSYVSTNRAIGVAGAGARVVLVTGDDGVTALDPASGSRLWANPFRPASFSTKYFWLANPNDCAVDRADTTVGCILRDIDGKKAIVVFLDAATGTQRGSTVQIGDAGISEVFQRSGDNFILGIPNSEVRGYRTDGSLAWHADAKTSFVNYADQGILIPGGYEARDVLDTATGTVIAHIDGGLEHSIAFTSGFAVNNYDQRIVFYDFTGRQIADVPADGFSLLEQTPYSPFVPQSSSGVDQPLAYNNATHQLRGYDGATGQPLWTTTVPDPDQYMNNSTVFGSGTYCFNGYARGEKEAVQVAACDQATTNPYLTASNHLGWLAGFDGQRALIPMPWDKSNRQSIQCVDVATGQEAWTITTDGIVKWLGNQTYVVVGNRKLQRWF
jgi:outer membrane protein assembly factor BamB